MDTFENLRTLFDEDAQFAAHLALHVKELRGGAASLRQLADSPEDADGIRFVAHKVRPILTMARCDDTLAVSLDSPGPHPRAQVRALAAACDTAAAKITRQWMPKPAAAPWRVRFWHACALAAVTLATAAVGGLLLRDRDPVIDDVETFPMAAICFALLLVAAGLAGMAWRARRLSPAGPVSLRAKVGKGAMAATAVLAGAGLSFALYLFEQHAIFNASARWYSSTHKTMMNEADLKAPGGCDAALAVIEGRQERSILGLILVRGLLYSPYLHECIDEAQYAAHVEILKHKASKLDAVEAIVPFLREDRAMLAARVTPGYVEMCWMRAHRDAKHETPPIFKAAEALKRCEREAAQAPAEASRLGSAGGSMWLRRR
jgi:hypothetical protein